MLVVEDLVLAGAAVDAVATAARGVDHVAAPAGLDPVLAATAADLVGAPLPLIPCRRRRQLVLAAAPLVLAAAAADAVVAALAVELVLALQALDLVGGARARQLVSDLCAEVDVRAIARVVRGRPRSVRRRRRAHGAVEQVADEDVARVGRRVGLEAERVVELLARLGQERPGDPHVALAEPISPSVTRLNTGVASRVPASRRRAGDAPAGGLERGTVDVVLARVRLVGARSLVLDRVAERRRLVHLAAHAAAEARAGLVDVRRKRVGERVLAVAPSRRRSGPRRPSGGAPFGPGMSRASLPGARAARRR